MIIDFTLIFNLFINNRLYPYDFKRNLIMAIHFLIYIDKNIKTFKKKKNWKKKIITLRQKIFTFTLRHNIYIIISNQAYLFNFEDKYKN